MVNQEKFWPRVIKTDTCWEWAGNIDSRGYGLVWFMGKSRLAHRVAMFLYTGEWPLLDVCHHCDYPACVRFEHLFTGTAQDNMNDMKRKGRQARWERGANSKLTWKEVSEIRTLYKKGVPGFSTVALGRKYGIAANNVWQIVSGNAWRSE